MIVVAGEALMDVVAGQGGQLAALPGGAPFNVARAVARAGGDCTYLGRLSDDRFGRLLEDELGRAGVRAAITAPATAPTPLALAELDCDGSASYRFYHRGTACADVSPDPALTDLVAGAEMLIVGGIVLDLEPIRSTLSGLVAAAPDHVTILCDPNCRPAAIGDPDAYRRHVDALLRRVDLLKVSVDDLAVLRPGIAPMQAATELARGAVTAVLVTDGPLPVTVVTATDQRTVPVEPVQIVDTIGAGDAFVAGFAAWWTRSGLTRAAVAHASNLERATRAATQLAARACRVSGAGFAL